MYQDDPWAAFNPQHPDAFTGVIPGAPKPQDPLDAQLKALTLQDRQLDVQKKRKDLDQGTEIAGQVDLSKLDQPTLAMAHALAEGRKSFPSGSALRSPYWQNMLSYVSAIDPGFDETSYTQRAATRRSYFAGTSGPAKSIRNLNTAIGHLGMLADQIDDTASHNFTPLNALENTASAMFGSSGPTKFRQTAENLASELTGVYREAGGAEADIDRYIGQLSPNASEEQKRSAIGNTVKLLKSKLDALNYQYGQGMGVAGKNLPEFLDAHAQEVFNKYALWADDPSKDPGGPSGGGGNGSGGGGGGGGAPDVTDLSADQKHAYGAFLAANPKPTGPQLKTFLENLLGKEVPNAESLAKGIREGRGASTTVENRTIQEKAEDMLRQGGGPGAAAITGAADAVGLGFSDEVGAGLSALGESLSGHGSFADNYSVDVGANRLYQQRLRGEHPIAYTGGQIGGGLLLPAGEVSGALDAAKVGAAYGGAYGVGSGDNGVGSRLAGGALGAVSGGSLGAGGYAAANALAPAVAPAINRLLPLSRREPQGMAPDVASAALAEGVDLVQPMVDPTSRGKFGALESAPGSQNVIREGVAKVRSQIEDRVANLGDGGTPLETDAAGERVQGAARQFIQRSKGVADRLYNRARALAGDARFEPKQAIKAIDDQVAELSSNPETNAGEIRFLQGVKNDLSTPGGKTVEELRQLRQSVRGRVNEQSLTATQAERRAMGVLDAAQQDVAANLPKGAADSYRRADTFYRERMVHVDDILERFLGGNVQQGQARLSGEQAFTRLKNMMAPGGDARRLAGLMRDLEPNERQDISATIAASLGRRSSDEPFSTDLFLSQTNKLSPQARRTVFGADGAQSIENLRLLSQKLKEGVGDFNRSKTANSMWRQMGSRFVASLTGLGGSVGLLEGGMAGGGTGAATGLLAGAAVKGAQTFKNVLSARAMVNPRVSKWLAEAADVSTPSQAKEAVRSLRLVISREPALAHELLPVHQFLDERVTQLLAAQPSNDDQER